MRAARIRLYVHANAMCEPKRTVVFVFSPPLKMHFQYTFKCGIEQTVTFGTCFVAAWSYIHVSNH